MHHEVAVFAPAPRLTITVEHPADDDEVHLHAGGQGVWVARMAAGLGSAVVLCAPFGGETGVVLRALLAGEHFDVEAVETATGNGVYVHDRRNGERMTIAEVPADSISRHGLDDLYGAALVTGLECNVTVLTGPAPSEPFPSDPYQRLAADVTGNDRLVVADVSGERMISALEGGVTVLKVSHEELVRDGRASSDGMDDLFAAAGGLTGARHVVISRASEPALAVVEGAAFIVTTPSVEPLDPKGAGDSMTAGIATGLARGWTVLDAIRLGAAAGALNATRRGLGTGDRTQIERLMQRVEVDELTKVER